MALLLPLHREGSSFELLLSSSTCYKALQSSAVSRSHWSLKSCLKSLLSSVPVLGAWDEGQVTVSMPGKILRMRVQTSWEVESLMASEPFRIGMNSWGHRQSHHCCVDWQLAFCKKPCSVHSSIQSPSAGTVSLIMEVWARIFGSYRYQQ